MAIRESSRKVAVEYGLVDVTRESDLQYAVESWLRVNGFWPRTPRAIAMVKSVGNRHRGWYIHLNKTKANPIILDMLILDSRTGQYLELELKTRSGVFSREQQAILAMGDGKSARTYEEAVTIITDWMET